MATYEIVQRYEGSRTWHIEAGTAEEALAKWGADGADIEEHSDEITFAEKPESRLLGSKCGSKSIARGVGKKSRLADALRKLA